ncbi:hypothetical protein [Planctomycetes bacterium CA13]
MLIDEFRHYSAPKSHGESFADPSIGDAGGLLRSNLSLLSQHDSSWQELRTEARRQLISDAVRYTSAYRKVELIANRDEAPIIMAGHQPSLFHSGVWFKNFVLDSLGKSHDAVAINLVIDNDAASGSSIRVPTIDKTCGEYVYQTVRYDRFGGGVPYEQTVITDRKRFDHFDEAVAAVVAPIIPHPLVNKLWQHAREAVERCGVAGCALAQARHALEGDIGLSTLEIPLGVVCRSQAFAKFLLMMLSDLPRFQEIYNSETEYYREVHGIRSSSHPVPNLASDGGDVDGHWYEAPIWLYSDAAPQRHAGWVKRTSTELILSNRMGLECRVSLDQSPAAAVEQLAMANTSELKIRPRALLTTMYARLVLSDLFLHGIGGGKYDQLGDRIAERFFGIDPPQFMVVSATVQLPGDSPSDLDARIRELKRKIRDVRFNPERFRDEADFDPVFLAEKRTLLDSVPFQDEHWLKTDKREWHKRVESINERLASQLEHVAANLQNELANAIRRRGSLAVLKSREHPFCIFPIDTLVETYKRLLA